MTALQYAERMVKSVISKTLIEELFRNIGLYVVKYGKEYHASHLTQLSYFVKAYDTKFKLEKSESKELIDKSPDFITVSKSGKVDLIEVKYRQAAQLEIQGENKIIEAIESYPTAIVILVNSYFSEKTDPHIKKAGDSRFHVISLKEGTKDEYIYMTLKEWLKVHHEIDLPARIQTHFDSMVKTFYSKDVSNYKKKL